MNKKLVISIVLIVGMSLYSKQLKRFGIAYVEGENPTELRIQGVVNQVISYIDRQRLRVNETVELRAALQEMFESAQLRFENGEEGAPTIAAIIQAIEQLGDPHTRMFPTTKVIYNFVRYHRVSFNNEQYAEIVHRILKYMDPYTSRPIPIRP